MNQQHGPCYRNPLALLLTLGACIVPTTAHAHGQGLILFLGLPIALVAYAIVAFVLCCLAPRELLKERFFILLVGFLIWMVVFIAAFILLLAAPKGALNVLSDLWLWGLPTLMVATLPYVVKWMHRKLASKRWIPAESDLHDEIAH